MSAAQELFGTLPDARPVERLRIAGGGLALSLLTLGATVQDLRLAGVDRPLVLGAPDLAPYTDELLYAGAVVGRFANRIAGARFSLDGRAYRTDANFRARHTLHGGREGTHAALWHVEERTADRVLMSLALADGHMGFPGTLRIDLLCALPGEGTLLFDMSAVTDAPTPCSLAHHGYFNLDGSADARGHRLRIAADRYLPVDGDLIPTGEIAPVAGTRFDFRAPRPIGDGGYDHNFYLARAPGGPVREAAELTGADGAVSLLLETDAPGLQLYDGGNLPPFAGGLDGRRYGPHAGVALETQAWPDAPNRADFPSPILRPGETFRHRVRYRFARR